MRSFLIILVLLSGLLFSGIQLSVKAESQILADVINQSAAAVNYTNDSWSNRESLTHMGILLGQLNLSAYDVEASYLAGVSDWTDLLGLVRIAEIDGYTSGTLQHFGMQALNALAMADSLPVNWKDQYLNYYRNELHGFDYAQKWNLNMSAWNLKAAYDAFVQAQTLSPSFVWSIASNGTVTSDDRHYDGGAQALSTFLQFDELGTVGALSQATGVWAKINSYNWPGWYPYHLGHYDTECEIGFSLIAGQYLERKGSITYEDRLIDDINYKLLENGWNSADWGTGGYVFCHSSVSPNEHRLPNTEIGWMVLNSFYPLLNNTMKTTVQDLLLGYGGYLPAWKGLLTTDLAESVNGVYRFRPETFSSWTNPQVTNTGTAQGCLTLFLEGIIPVTGSLNIANRDEVYEDVCSEMSAKDFLFDYADHMIRIPVRAGEIEFQFGSGTASYTFPASGTYTVQFSDDWNTVIGASLSGSSLLGGSTFDSRVLIVAGFLVIVVAAWHTRRKKR